MLKAMEVPGGMARRRCDAVLRHVRGVRMSAERREARLEEMTVLHDFNKFCDMMRRGGAAVARLSEVQRNTKPPGFGTHGHHDRQLERGRRTYGETTRINGTARCGRATLPRISSRTRPATRTQTFMDGRDALVGQFLVRFTRRLPTTGPRNTG